MRVFTILLLLSYGLCAHVGDGRVVLRYLANDGISIHHEASNSHIIIDGLFDQYYEQFEVPSDSTLALIFSSTGPFQGKRLHLVTHIHRDHVYAELLSKDLRNDGVEALVPQQVGDLMAEEGLQNFKIVQDGSVHTFEEFTVEVIEMRHVNPRFKDITNLAFLVTIGSKKILHIGDATVDEENMSRIGEGKVDLIVLPYFVLSDEAIQLINEKFDSPMISPIHYNVETKQDMLQELRTMPNTLILSEPLVPVEMK